MEDPSKASIMGENELQLVLLGTGTSSGIPAAGCFCHVCTSDDPRDQRNRTSALLRNNKDISILIDCGPEFRIEAHKHRIEFLSGVLITHDHADHTHGIDDLKYYTLDKNSCLYGTKGTLDSLSHRFDYIFKPTQKAGPKPKLTMTPVDSPFFIHKVPITPIPVKHGSLDIFGYRIGNTAYITDVSYVPQPSMRLIEGIEILIIDALGIDPHPTHFNFEKMLNFVKTTSAKLIRIIHLTHTHTTVENEAFLRSKIEKNENLSTRDIKIGYDGEIINGIRF